MFLLGDDRRLVISVSDLRTAAACEFALVRELDVVLGRVGDRANPFGSTPGQRAKIAADRAAFEPLLRAGADHEIVTTGAVEEVASALERIAGAASGPRAGRRF